MVWWLACWTSDLKVGGSRPSPHCVVSLDKKIYPTLSPSTQVRYKKDTGDILLGVTLQWTRDVCATYFVVSSDIYRSCRI